MRFYHQRAESDSPCTTYHVSVPGGNGTHADIEVTETVFEALIDLQREYWRLERRESRHTYHLELIGENHLPRSSFARNPEQVLVERLETGEIHRALRGLSDVQQRRFLMRHLEERSIKQIAQSEGCSERAVKYSLNHARKNLREMLSEHGGYRQKCVSNLKVYSLVER